MTKILALALCTLALGACSDMHGPHWMRNSSDTSATRNSTDANRSGNPAAVSPGGGAAGGSSGSSGSR